MLKATSFVFVLVLLVTSTMAIDLTKPIPEIRLKDGTTLRNVEFRSYSAASVMVRHSNGVGTIKYEQLSDELYDAILTYRKESPQVAKAIPEEVVAVRNFIASLSSPLPEYLTLEKYFGDGSGQAVIRGRYTGELASGVDHLREFTQNIQNSPKVMARYATVKLTSLDRNYQTGELDYEIVLSPKGVVEATERARVNLADPVADFLRLNRENQLAALQKGRPRLPTLSAPEDNWGEKALLKPKLTGQIFITTQGGATFKMSGVTVKVFPRSYAKTLLGWVRHPGQPAVACMDFYAAHNAAPGSGGLLQLFNELRLGTWASIETGKAETTTDADGRFDIASPFSDYVLFAMASRVIGEKTEYYIWLLTSDNVPEKDKILLNGNNTVDSWTY